jgi:hypothetical protein
MNAPDSCPDIEVLCAWLEGELDADADHDLREHLARCPRCAREAAAALSFLEEDAGRPVDPEVVASIAVSARSAADARMECARPSANKRSTILAAAAGLLVAATFFVLWDSDASKRPERQAIPAPDVPRGGAMRVEILTEEEGWRVTWEAVPAATSYRVVLSDGLAPRSTEETRGEEFWVSGTSATDLRELTLVVEAIDDRAEVVGTSSAIPLRAGPRTDDEVRP